MTAAETLLLRAPRPRWAPGWTATVAFAVLVLALSATQLLPSLLERLGAAVPGWLLGLSVLVGGGLSPVWAVLLVGALTTGRPGVRRLLRESLRLRVDLRLHLAALLVPAAITAVAAGVAAIATGATPALASGTAPEPMRDGLAAWAVKALVLAPLFALSENLGWRAWLQRGLQVRLSPWIAGVVVGLVWSLWHLPLWQLDPLYAQLPVVAFVLATTVRSVLLAAFFNASEASIMPVALAHWAFNIATQLCLPEDLAETTALYVALTVTSAIAAVLVARWSRSKAAGDRLPVL